MRQFFAVLTVVILTCGLAQAQQEPCAVAGTNNDFLGIQTIRLWPGDAPESKGKACEDTPTLTIFEPAHGHGNGSAVVILPGGAYLHLASNHEGRQVADWFTTRGFRAFVLSYRLATHGYLLPVPLLDAQRAVQTVRARARDYQIDPNRIVIIGFSAGGHLAALASTQFVAGKPEAEDPIERVSSRPDYLVLGYPWIGAVSGPNAPYVESCKKSYAADTCEAIRNTYSPELFGDQRDASDLLVPHLQRPGGPGGAGAEVLRGAGQGRRSLRGAHLPRRTARRWTGQGRSGSGPVAQPAGELAARAGAADGRETSRQTVGN
jgi:acetyl esterase/lipase